MKCSGCQWYSKSKVYGNGCNCRKSPKPCEAERKRKGREKVRSNRNKKYMEE